MRSRSPLPALTPFVGRIWVSDGTSGHAAGTERERVLPTGANHLVLRLGDEPLRLFEPRGERVVGTSMLGGARARAYLKDVSRAAPSVGAMLEPGASLALFGVSADELAGTHTPLDALWGAEAALWADELAAVADPDARLDRFEQKLLARLPRVRAIHPGVVQALSEARRGDTRASALAKRAGLSGRRFGQVFRETVGLSPKRWLRVQRFQRALRRARDPDLDWADLALELGYSDQPHLVREFRELSGVTPSEYRRLAPASRNHLPVARGPLSSRRR